MTERDDHIHSSWPGEEPGGPFVSPREADRPHAADERVETRGISERSGGRRQGGLPDGERVIRPFAGRGPKSYQRADESIADEVNRFLTMDDEIDATEIEVLVEDAVVTLRGEVADRYQKRLAGMVAGGVFGVKDVMNEIRCRPAPS
jgi:hypothetical protein